MGKVSLSDVHELDVEDLLDREPVIPDAMLLNQNTNNKTVLITGAGESIGSELCRQVLKRMPRRILLVDMSEFALYQINQEILSLRELSCANSSSLKNSISGLSPVDCTGFELVCHQHLTQCKRKVV